MINRLLAHKIMISQHFARLIFIPTFALCLSACSITQPVQKNSDATTTPEVTDQAQTTEASTQTAQNDGENTQDQIETRPLTSPFIYRFLLGEIAGQRGDFYQSSHIFYQLAQSEKDARFAERAAKIAAYGHVNNLVFPAVQLWAELAPESREAQQAITEILVKSNKIADAEPHLANLLVDEKTRAAGFILMGKLLNQAQDKAAVLTLVQNLAQPYPDLPEAHIAIAQSAMQVEQNNLAISHLDQADALRPGWNLPALLKGQLLFSQSIPEAIAFHETFLTKHPKLNDVRLNFARALVQHKQYDRAKAEFPIIIEEAHSLLNKTASLDEETDRQAKKKVQKGAEKNLADTLTIIGLLSFQSQDYVSANSYFQQALDFNYDDPDQIYLYFGQVAEKQIKPKLARSWYERVEKGQHYLAAQVNIASLINTAESADAAIQYLDAIDHLNVEEQIVITQTQANILSEAKRYQETFLFLKKAVEAKPQAVALQYDYALAAERVQEYTIMETQLHAVIQARPNFAPAYNALGYSFADRNIHLDRALSLIQKALTIAPNDHYMLDSLGWVYYRLGQLDTAVLHLQKAFDIQHDPEIAAHLGEVLWQQGKEEEAKKIWQESLKQFPDNEILISTIKKYQS